MRLPMRLHRLRQCADVGGMCVVVVDVGDVEYLLVAVQFARFVHVAQRVGNRFHPCFGGGQRVLRVQGQNRDVGHAVVRHLF